MTALPTLKEDGRSTLDAYLQESVAQQHTPALFFGATNAKETIYFNQAGEIKFDDPSSGQVNEDTSKWS
jgi:methyl acetate hydrolase